MASDRPIVGRSCLRQVIINLVMNGVEAMSVVDDRPRELVIRSDGHDGRPSKGMAAGSGATVNPTHGATFQFTLPATG